MSEGVLYLNRTHPVVEAVATYVMDTALDPLGNGVARRAGVIRTSRVSRRTTLLVVTLSLPPDHQDTRSGDCVAG